MQEIDIEIKLENTILKMLRKKIEIFLI